MEGFNEFNNFSSDESDPSFESVILSDSYSECHDEYSMNSDSQCSEFDESTSDESTSDESTSDESTSNESTSDESTSDESTSDESTSDESTSDESTSDESTSDESPLIEVYLSDDERQFIVHRVSGNEVLPYSALFYINDEAWQLLGFESLLISPKRFIAIVSCEGTVYMKDGNFQETIRRLLKHLKVENVLLDAEMTEWIELKNSLQIILETIGSQSGDNIQSKRDVMMLRTLLTKHGNSLNMPFKLDVIACHPPLSRETMLVVDNYVMATMKLTFRNEILGLPNDCSTSGKFIEDAIRNGLTIRRKRLQSLCPFALQGQLERLSDDDFLYISADDIVLFEKLAVLSPTMFDADVMSKLFSKFLTKIKTINDWQVIASFSNDSIPSNEIFLHVCKSMCEIAAELTELAASTKKPVIFYSDSIGWVVPPVRRPTQFANYLMLQLKLLAALANHFEPSGPWRATRYPYDLAMLENLHNTIPESDRVWLCLLDNCVKHLIPSRVIRTEMLSSFYAICKRSIIERLGRGYVMEGLRIQTNRTIRLVAGHDHDYPAPAYLLLRDHLRCRAYCANRW